MGFWWLGAGVILLLETPKCEGRMPQKNIPVTANMGQKHILAHSSYPVERPSKCTMELQASRRCLSSIIFLVATASPLAYSYIVKPLSPTSRASSWAQAQVPLATILHLHTTYHKLQ